MNTLKIIESREKEISPLYDRIKRDRAKIGGEQYRLKRLDDPNCDADHVVNVTMNNAARDCENLISLIMRSKMQCVVEGWKNDRAMSDKETGRFETFLSAVYDLIDDNLNRRNKGPLRKILGQDIVQDGWTAACFMTYINANGLYVPDYVRWDMTGVAWEYNRDTLEWASHRFKRPASLLNRQYGLSLDEGKEYEGVAFYDNENEEIWIGDALAKTTPHLFGHVPVIIQAAYAGSGDESDIEHMGESAIYLIRDLIDQFNMSVSIEQTAALKSILPAYQKTTADMSGPAPAYPDKPGAVTEHAPNEDYALLPAGDMNQAAQLGRADIQRAMQLAGSDIDTGSVDQGWSAVAISAISELRNKSLIPRLDALSSFLQKMSEMILKQREVLDFEGALGLPNNRAVFKRNDFLGDITIRYRFMSKTKEMEIANLSLAAAAKGTLPQRVIIRDVLQSENTDEIMAMLESEQAEQDDPVIGLTRRALALIDEADLLADEDRDAKLIESMMLTERAVAVIMSRKTQPQEVQPTQQKASTNVLLPLLGGAKKAGNNGN